MTNALYHRGPDSGAHWIEQGIALGHRRLSVLELSTAGNQPMVSVSGRYVIVFNGEIYNHCEIRSELMFENWAGNSDTETLLVAIEEWGLLKVLGQIRGMFAFAVWDKQFHTLSLARDRMGEKPLYYGWSGNAFLFGSELKSLKLHPNWEGRINQAAVYEYMRLGYVPAPFSIYEGINKLVPGGFIELSSQSHPGFQPPVYSYWSASDSKKSPYLDLSGQEAIETLEKLIKDSISRQMIADVPIGAFLSGGIDSSSIVSLMQAQTSGPVKTFSVGFKESSFDESIYAKNIANFLNTDHTEIQVDSEDVLNLIPDLPTIFDEPFGDSSGIPTFLISKLARQHVTVALTGDGGDELFAGYNRYVWCSKIWENIDKIPLNLRMLIGRSLTSLSPSVLAHLYDNLSFALPKSYRVHDIGDKIHKFGELVVSEDTEDLYRNLISHHKGKVELVLGENPPSNWAQNQCKTFKGDNFLDFVMFQDQVGYLPDNILTKVDRAMASSLETRIPLLDHDIVEFSWKISQEYKVKGNQTKWLLRQILKRHIPQEFFQRPKQGFTLPLDDWLRGALTGLVRTIAQPKSITRTRLF